MEKKILQTSFFTGILLLSGCGTIINGSKEQVYISGNNTSVKVSIDGHEQGIAPFDTDLIRKQSHIIKITPSDSLSYEVKLIPRISKIIILDILGDLVGAGVDAITGDWNHLIPVRIDTLKNKGGYYLEYSENPGFKGKKFGVCVVKTKVFFKNIAPQ